MRVGEAFARVMGQPLRFEELDGARATGEDGVVEEGGRGDGGDGDDPAAAEEGEGEEGEELQPYDLSDDEADLLPVAPPKYLRRIVECTCGGIGWIDACWITWIVHAGERE